jgi:hypothetical protein
MAAKTKTPPAGVDGIDWEALAAPFPAWEVKWRIGSVTKDGRRASVLAFIDARAVYDRLDAVVGPASWKIEHHTDGPRRLATLSLEVAPGVWVGKTDGADDTDVEATKGGISDAAKRAAVLWGIGRYLYSLPASWFEVVDKRPSASPDGVEPLRTKDGKWVPPPTLPKWALPDKAPAAPSSLHHASWDKDARGYCAAVGDVAKGNRALAEEVEAAGYDDLHKAYSAWCEDVGKPRPSAMDSERRREALRYLQTPAGQERVRKWLAGESTTTSTPAVREPGEEG